MKKTAETLLRQAALYSDGQEYRLLRLPANGIVLAAGLVAEGALSFSALIVDKDEVSLLLPQAVCDEFSQRLRRAQISAPVYRLISFDIELAPSLVGFIARISAMLAAAEIPILTYAAYSRDHIFVPVEHFERAMQTLKHWQKAEQ